MKGLPNILVSMQPNTVTANVTANATTNASINSSKGEQHLHLNPKRPFISINRAASQIARTYPSGNVCLCIEKLPSQYKFAFLNYVAKQLYSFDKYVSKKQEVGTVYVHDKANSKSTLACFLHVLHCADTTRNLQNEPANMMSPDMFTKTVKKILLDTTKHTKSKCKVKVTVKDEKDMRKEGLNLVLAIGLSSKRMPRFMTIECTRDKTYPTICLVGKTVVYDAGGLNIKLGKSMGPEMKDDKAGGSVVVGVIQHFIEHDVKCNIVGILPIVENVLSEDVTRPGDIVKSYDGKTVEITDTDAEGRLVLADAISYSKKFKPTYLFDLATLTGWAEGVHMDLASVCYCKNMELAAKINAIGEKVGERVWFLPPWDEYTYYTQSTVADIRNFNLDMREGAYLPSMFLLTFVPHELRDRYVHFDMCNNFKRDLAQGQCVALMIELIKHLCDNP